MTLIGFLRKSTCTYFGCVKIKVLRRWIFEDDHSTDWWNRSSALRCWWPQKKSCVNLSVSIFIQYRSIYFYFWFSNVVPSSTRRVMIGSSFKFEFRYHVRHDFNIVVICMCTVINTIISLSISFRKSFRMLSIGLIFVPSRKRSATLMIWNVLDQRRIRRWLWTLVGEIHIMIVALESWWSCEKFAASNSNPNFDFHRFAYSFCNLKIEEICGSRIEKIQYLFHFHSQRC